MPVAPCPQFCDYQNLCDAAQPVFSVARDVHSQRQQVALWNLAVP